MVDSVMIDTAYDGSVFNVVVADIPERKADLVLGEYEVSLAEGSSAPVAVNITELTSPPSAPATDAIVSGSS